jgi:hypothetical protein
MTDLHPKRKPIEGGSSAPIGRGGLAIARTPVTAPCLRAVFASFVARFLFPFGVVIIASIRSRSLGRLA